METSGYARKLLFAREKANKTVSEMAAFLNISTEAYYDLESYDDEITGCLSLRQVAMLFNALNIDPKKFFDAAAQQQLKPISLEEFGEMVKRYISHHKMTSGEFEDRVGWEIQRQIEDTSRFLEYNIEGLKDVSNELGIDWLPVVEGVIARL